MKLCDFSVGKRARESKTVNVLPGSLSSWVVFFCLTGAKNSMKNSMWACGGWRASNSPMSDRVWGMTPPLDFRTTEATRKAQLCTEPHFQAILRNSYY